MDSKRFLLVGIALACVLVGASYDKNVNRHEEAVVEYAFEQPIEVEIEKAVEPEPVKVVVYRVTAYCPCEICCGEWAKNRPTDANGNPIVVGSLGVELTDGYSAASPLEFGTQVELNGVGTVEIQDRTANWVVEEHGENIIDLYMTDHDAAWNFGVKYIEGVIK